MREDEARIKHLAFHDPLTGLANGRLFNEHLATAIARARRHQQRLAVLFCDLDRFKNVNDSLGHVVGNRLLQEMASRLRDGVREADVLARLGGDEFTILLEDLRDPDDAGAVAAKVLAAIARPFDVDGHQLHVSTSVGLAVYPDDGDDADTLLKNADAAMYAAKSRRGAWARYEPEMNARTGHLLLLESGLHDAIERQELEVHYQPQVDARTRDLVAVEALVRCHQTLERFLCA
jgi:diguanylate cyclase (GGDEF)-like protein